MKKIIAISLVAVSFAATSAFGQGYFQFTSGKSPEVYDCFTTPGVSVPGVGLNVAFLWAAAFTTPTVAVLTGLASTPTDANANLNYTMPQAWGAILNGQFTMATNAADNSLVKATVLVTGAFNYNGGAAFGVAGTIPGTTYTIYEIGWSAAYATPWLAAAANGPLGWSAPIQYTAVTSIGTPNSMSVGSFGVFGVPEPATMALAALGSLSLLAFRRRNK